MSLFCRRLLSAVVAVVAASLVVGASLASAEITHEYVCQITGTSPGSASECQSGGSATPLGAVSRPVGLTISAGELWTASAGTSAIDEFGTAGGFVAQIPGTGTGYSFHGSAESVARDDSTGTVYLGDSGPDNVKVFDNTGAFLTTWSGSSTPSGSFGGTNVSVAVDNSTTGSPGDVYVLDGSQNVIDKLSGGTTAGSQPTPVAFSGAASYISGSQLTGTPSGRFAFTSSDNALAVDSSGNLYVADNGNKVVDEFSSSGVFVRSFVGTGTPTGSFGTVAAVGVDDVSGEVYVVDSTNKVVDEFSSSGTYLGQTTGAGTPAGAFTPEGAAVDPATGDLFVTDSAGHVIDRFGPDVVVPDVTTGQPSGVAGTSATVTGTVNPDGTTVTSCQFQYLAAAEYSPSAADPFSGAPAAACAATPSGSSPVAVTANLSGLVPDTTYYVRLEAANSTGTNTGQVVSFVAPGTAAGPVPTTGAVGLPDGRVYEQVSPVNKDGNTGGATYTGSGLVPDYTLASADGDALMSGSPVFPQKTFGANAFGSQPFAVYRRSASGWSNSGLWPVQNGQPEVTVPQSMGLLTSEDLSSAVFGADFSFGSAPANSLDLVNPDGSLTWLSQPTISDPVTATGVQATPPWVVGGSPDLSTIYFQDEGTLLPSDDQANAAFGGASRHSVLTANGGGASAGLYEWTAAGGVQYAGVLPDGSVDPYGATLASYGSVATTSNLTQPTSFIPAQYFTNPVSSDGSKVLFVSPDPRSKAPASDPVELYDHETAADGSQKTVLISKSAVTGLPAADSPVSLSPPVPSGASGGDEGFVQSYDYASPDGSHVFFEDVDALTSSAPNDTTQKAYDYDTTTNTLTYLPGVAGQPNANLVDGSCCTSPVLVSSTDGSEFLFLKTTAGGASLNLWSAAGVTPVAQFPETGCSDNGLPGPCMVPEARVSSDGSVFVFETDSPLYTTSPGQFNNAGGFEQIYRYVVATGQLSCLSCGTAAVTHTGDALMSNNVDQGGVEVIVSGLITDSRGISSDGDRVFFQSPDPLVPHASNGQDNVYEWEAGGDGSCPSGTAGGCLFLISTGQAPGADFFLDNSANGNDVFFATLQGLDAQDTTQDYDIYDARVGGGFPAPPAGAAPCSGDACQGPVNAAPSLPTAASVSFAGPGNMSSAKAPAAAAKVLTKTVRGATFLVRVRVPGAGRITVTAAGIATATKSVSKAGVDALRVDLTGGERSLLARRHRLTLQLRVSFSPRGGQPRSVEMALAVRPALRRAATGGRRATSHKQGGAR